MLNKLCRACLTTKETFTYFLFEDISPEVYLFCTSIEVQKDELPKALCNICYELITRYSEFKRTCIRSQDTLLNCNENFVSITTQKALDSDVFDTPIEPEFNNIKVENSNYDDALHTPEPPHEPLPDVQEPEAPPFDVNAPTVKKKKKSSKLKCRPKEATPKKCFLYACDMCSKRFRYLESYEAHKMEHEGKMRALGCSACGKRFATWSGLRRHREGAHAAVRLARLACAHCGRVCASRHALRAHARAHVPRRARASAAAVVCHVCGQRVATALVLRTHLETHKEDRERTHTCEHCGKKFFTNTALQSHISRLHTGRRYVCDNCHYPFTDKHNLAKHMLIHDGIKLYKCDICHKAYSTNQSLVEHKRTHSGERPYGCDYCPKSFISKRRLVDHYRIHTGEKPHRCSLCEQRFTQRGTLRRHMKVHDKIVPVI